jgi:hypothetical protein
VQQAGTTRAAQGSATETRLLFSGASGHPGRVTRDPRCGRGAAATARSGLTPPPACIRHCWPTRFQSRVPKYVPNRPDPRRHQRFSANLSKRAMSRPKGSRAILSPETRVRIPVAVPRETRSAMRGSRSVHICCPQGPARPSKNLLIAGLRGQVFALWLAPRSGLPPFAQWGSAMPGIRAPEMHGKQYLLCLTAECCREGTWHRGA